jgi:hypothetical protein
MPSSWAMASAQIVFPVPGGPAKLNANPRPAMCRSPKPHRPKIRLWFRTWASACSNVRRVCGGRTTSANVRSGVTVSTTLRERFVKNEIKGLVITDSDQMTRPARPRRFGGGGCISRPDVKLIFISVSGKTRLLCCSFSQSNMGFWLDGQISTPTIYTLQ